MITNPIIFSVLAVSAIFMFALCCMMMSKEEYKQKPLLIVLITAGMIAGIVIDSRLPAGASILLPYFIVQSISDAKIKKVHSLLNNILMLFALASFLAFSFISGFTITQVVANIALAVVIPVAFLYKSGSGDKKCAISMYLLLNMTAERLFGFYDIRNSIGIFMLYLLISNVTMLLFFFVKSKKEKVALKSYGNTYFFPFLFVGYVSILLLQI